MPCHGEAVRSNTGRCTNRRERAMKSTVPLIRGLAPVINRWIGVMKLVSSDVRCISLSNGAENSRYARRRGGVQRRGTRLWGRESPERAQPEGPLRPRPEGQKNEGSVISQIRKAPPRRIKERQTFIPLGPSSPLPGTQKKGCRLISFFRSKCDNPFSHFFLSIALILPCGSEMSRTMIQITSPSATTERPR